LPDATIGPPVKSLRAEFWEVSVLVVCDVAYVAIAKPPRAKTMVFDVYWE